jgi:hypothetical protein
MKIGAHWSSLNNDIGYLVEIPQTQHYIYVLQHVVFYVGNM